MMVSPSNLYLFLLVTVIPSRETLLVMTMCTRLWDGGEGAGCSLHLSPVRVKDLEAYMYRAWTPGCATGTCWSESLGRYPWYWKCACRSSWADWFKFPVLRKELGQVIFRAPFQTQLWAYDFVSRFSPVEGWRRLAVVIKTQHQDFWFLFCAFTAEWLAALFVTAYALDY